MRIRSEDGKHSESGRKKWSVWIANNSEPNTYGLDTGRLDVSRVSSPEKVQVCMLTMLTSL